MSGCSKPPKRKGGRVVTRSVALAHIIRQDDGTSIGVWGIFVLKSAFQPVFAFCDGHLEVTAFEGLLRPFRDDEPLRPDRFLAMVAEEDRLHVETLARTLHLLNAGRFLSTDASIFINFDPSVFSDPEVAETALRDMRLVLHEAGIDPPRIVCELTEKKSQSEEGLRAFVEALRHHGYRIAVDDYGAEESDIHRIKELRPDIVKFDAHWISHLMESGPGLGLLSTMVREFASQGIDSVFEGLEEGWQLDLAERAGASMVQGFVLARPALAPTDFDVFYKAEVSVAAVNDDVPLTASAEPAPHAEPRPRKRAFGRRSGRS